MWTWMKAYAECAQMKEMRWTKERVILSARHPIDNPNRFMVDFSSSLNLRKLKMTIISDDDARSC